MSTIELILNKVRDQIRHLGLPGLDDRKVSIRRRPWDDRQVYRGVTIHSLEDRFGSGLNGADDVGYGIGITIITGKADETGLYDRVPEWRDRIRNTFHNRKLPGVDDVYVCKVTLGDVYLPGQYRKSNDATQLILRAWVEAQR
jgi:hypothetical protein